MVYIKQKFLVKLSSSSSNHLQPLQISGPTLPPASSTMDLQSQKNRLGLPPLLVTTFFVSPLKVGIPVNLYSTDKEERATNGLISPKNIQP